MPYQHLPIVEELIRTLQQKASTKNMAEKDTMATLAKKIDNKAHIEREERFKDVVFERDGKKFILPEGMTFQDAALWLERKSKEEDITVVVSEEVDAYVLDGAYAFAKAIARTYGFSGLIPTPGWFSSPPSMIGLEVGISENGVTETIQVPWGAVQIPGMEGYLNTGFARKENRFIFTINGEVKQKHRGAVAKLAELTREIARNESVYKAQAIRIRFPKEGENFSPAMAPKFIDLSKVNENELLFNDDVMGKVQTSIFNAIEKTDLARKFKIPLKTGVLLAGKFGTGKTMTANHAAKKCLRNKWTFIYLENVLQLKDAILFAKSYQPAVIFAEDIDRAVSGDRDEHMDGILNTIDGVDTKNSEIMVVLTTNALDNINKAMLRPGRLDSVIEVTPPDAKTAIKLIRLYGRGLIEETENLDEVGKLLDGQIPAFIQQVVERSKRAALTHLGSSEQMMLHSRDLEIAAATMRDHVALLEELPDDDRTDMEILGEAIGGQLAAGMTAVAEDYAKEMETARRLTAPTPSAESKKNGNGTHTTGA